MAGRKLKTKLTQNPIAEARKQLLDWYDKHGRELPWRMKNGAKPNAYHVWLSEIMAQQTTLAAVIPYFLKFTEKWPDIEALAAAPQDEIMKEWAGLGYYARARNLHKAAGLIAENGFPPTQAALKKLPGIGEYISAAIAAIVYKEPATVVDGNVERVISRYFSIETPLPSAKPAIKEKASLFYQDFHERPGDLAQAFMDLGAMICTPKNPKCLFCPLRQTCEARKKGLAEILPRKVTEKAKPQKYGYAYWITDRQGQVLLHRRPEKGLLAGMIGLPTSSWEESRDNIIPPDISDLKIAVLKSHVLHSFTHFDLRLDLMFAETDKETIPGYFWMPAESIAKAGLPSVFKKTLKFFESRENIVADQGTDYT